MRKTGIMLRRHCIKIGFAEVYEAPLSSLRRTSIQQPACEGGNKSRVQSKEALLAHKGDACCNLRKSQP